MSLVARPQIPTASPAPTPRLDDVPIAWCDPFSRQASVVSSVLGLHKVGDIKVIMKGRHVDKEGVIKYSIEIFGPTGAHLVERRYSDFAELHRAIFGEKADTAVEMPPKNYFQSIFSPKFQEQREQRLGEVVVAAVASVADLELDDCPPALRKFLGLRDVAAASDASSPVKSAVRDGSDSARSSRTPSKSNAHSPQDHPVPDDSLCLDGFWMHEGTVIARVAGTRLHWMADGEIVSQLVPLIAGVWSVEMDGEYFQAEVCRSGSAIQLIWSDGEVWTQCPEPAEESSALFAPRSLESALTEEPALLKQSSVDSALTKDEDFHSVPKLSFVSALSSEPTDLTGKEELCKGTTCEALPTIASSPASPRKEERDECVETPCAQGTTCEALSNIASSPVSPRTEERELRVETPRAQPLPVEDCVEPVPVEEDRSPARRQSFMGEMLGKARAVFNFQAKPEPTQTTDDGRVSTSQLAQTEDSLSHAVVEDGAAHSGDSQQIPPAALTSLYAEFEEVKAEPARAVTPLNQLPSVATWMMPLPRNDKQQAEKDTDEVDTVVHEECAKKEVPPDIFTQASLPCGSTACEALPVVDIVAQDGVFTFCPSPVATPVAQPVMEESLCEASTTEERQSLMQGFMGMFQLAEESIEHAKNALKRAMTDSQEATAGASSSQESVDRAGDFRQVPPEALASLYSQFGENKAESTENKAESKAPSQQEKATCSGDFRKVPPEAMASLYRQFQPAPRPKEEDAEKLELQVSTGSTAASSSDKFSVYLSPTEKEEQLEQKMHEAEEALAVETAKLQEGGLLPQKLCRVAPAICAAAAMTALAASAVRLRQRA